MKDDLAFSLFLFFFVISCILSLFFAVMLLIDNYREIEEKNNIIIELKEKNELLLNSGQSSIIQDGVSTDLFYVLQKIDLFTN